MTYSLWQICISTDFFPVKNGELITRYRENPNSEKMYIGMLLAEERNKAHFLQCVWLHFPGLSLKSRFCFPKEHDFENLVLGVPGASLYCRGHESKNKGFTCSALAEANPVARY